MTCAEADPLLNAYFDGELDLAGSLGVERHLSECAACSLLYQNLQRLREDIAAADLDFGANANLHRLRSSIRRRTGLSRPWLWRAWIPALAAAALVIGVMVPSRIPRTSGSSDREVVDSHVRSLMSDHLMDVPSSDRHTVKPWFQGKLNFSPPVLDLGAYGFVLTGGRLDVVGGRPAAAIVYKRRGHIINLLVAPAEHPSDKLQQSQLDGYHVVQWRTGALGYWAVSDLNAAELGQFAELVRRESAGR